MEGSSYEENVRPVRARTRDVKREERERSLLVIIKISFLFELLRISMKSWHVNAFGYSLLMQYSLCSACTNYSDRKGDRYAGVYVSGITFKRFQRIGIKNGTLDGNGRSS